MDYRLSADSLQGNFNRFFREAWAGKKRVTSRKKSGGFGGRIFSGLLAAVSPFSVFGCERTSCRLFTDRRLSGALAGFARLLYSVMARASARARLVAPTKTGFSKYRPC